MIGRYHDFPITLKNATNKQKATWNRMQKNNDTAEPSKNTIYIFG